MLLFTDTCPTTQCAKHIDLDVHACCDHHSWLFDRRHSFVTQSGGFSGRQDRYRCMYVVEDFVCNCAT